MSKSNNKPHDIFTTTRGIEIHLLPVGPWAITAATSAVQLPDKPQYEIKTVAGNVEKYDHNETTLKTDEDRAAWAAYKADLAQAQNKQYIEMARLLIEDGIASIPEPPAEWWAKMERRGIAIPAQDSYERRLALLEYYCLGSANEFLSLLMAIMALGQDVPEEAIQQIESAFKSGVARIANQYIGDTARRLGV